MQSVFAENSSKGMFSVVYQIKYSKTSKKSLITGFLAVMTTFSFWSRDWLLDVNAQISDFTEIYFVISSVLR